VLRLPPPLQSIDKNGDGTIEAHELRDALKEKGSILKEEVRFGRWKGSWLVRWLLRKSGWARTQTRSWAQCATAAGMAWHLQHVGRVTFLPCPTASRCHMEMRATVPARQAVTAAPFGTKLAFRHDLGGEPSCACNWACKG
jgi:hypothetical protein